ncbi:MAG: hypothetical protein ABI655_13715 [Phenylobacterium sp.]
MWFTVTFFCSVALIAFWEGGWRERAIASGQVLVIALGHHACHTWQCWGPGRPPLMVLRPLIDDAFLLAICLVCAHRADRYWVLWASAFALLCVVTDLVGLFPSRLTQWAVASGSVIWNYLLVVMILVGVWTSARARRLAKP